MKKFKNYLIESDVVLISSQFSGNQEWYLLAYMLVFKKKGWKEAKRINLTFNAFKEGTIYSHVAFYFEDLAAHKAEEIETDLKEWMKQPAQIQKILNEIRNNKEYRLKLLYTGIIEKIQNKDF